MSTLTDKIKSRNHWWIDVHPTTYRSDRLDYSGLESALAALVVRMRGWPVPFVDDRKHLLRGDNWIGQDVDAETVDIYEAWRFTTAAQFTHLRSVSASWRTGKEATTPPPGFEAALEVWEILYYLTEVVLLSARLAADQLANDEEIEIRAHLRLVQTTMLVGGFRDRAPLDSHPGPTELAPKSITMTAEKLVAEPAVAAIDLASQIFSRFGWNPSPQLLQGMQRDLYQR